MKMFFDLPIIGIVPIFEFSLCLFWGWPIHHISPPQYNSNNMTPPPIIIRFSHQQHIPPPSPSVANLAASSAFKRIFCCCCSLRLRSSVDWTCIGLLWRSLCTSVRKMDSTWSASESASADVSNSAMSFSSAKTFC